MQIPETNFRDCDYRPWVHPRNLLFQRAPQAILIYMEFFFSLRNTKRNTALTVVKYCLFPGILPKIGRVLSNHGFSMTGRNFIVHGAIASMAFFLLLENLKFPGQEQLEASIS